MIYRIVRAILCYALGGFFRQVRLQGADAVPESGPVLFVVNHTNAFVDPLVVINGIRRPVTITAKSTLAKNPLLAPLIRAMGVILFHRHVDAAAGQADPSKNSNAIGLGVDRLSRGGALLFFPEGVSHSDPGMRDFKSGAARIAMQHLADPNAPDLTIVPVGLHFTKKDRWRSEAVGLVGEPVSGRAWIEAHPGEGAGALTAAMRGWIEALTLNFGTEQERALVLDADRLFGYRGAPEPLDRRIRLDAAQRVARVHRLQRGAHVLRTRAPEQFDALARETQRLARSLAVLGVEPEEAALPMHLGRVAMFVVREIEVLVVGFVPAVLGWLIHLPPLTLLRVLVARMSEDEDHPASNAVFLSIPVIGVWWALALVLAAVALPIRWLPVVVVALPFSAAVHLSYRDRVGATWRRVRTFLLWLRRPDLRTALEEEIQAWQGEVRRLEETFTGAGLVPSAAAGPNIT